MLNDNVIMTCKLTRKMSQILPNFKVNVSYRAVKVSKLFSFLAKAENDTYQKSDVVYEFTCPCKEIYIGQTSRDVCLLPEFANINKILVKPM